MSTTISETNGSEKQKLIQEKSVYISNTYDCQTGILTPFDINEHALYIICMFLVYLIKILFKFNFSLFEKKL